jgi:hypothetical protein
VRVTKRDASRNAALLLLLVLLVSIPSQDQVLGEVQFVGKSKTEKTSGVFF